MCRESSSDDVTERCRKYLTLRAHLPVAERDFDPVPLTVPFPAPPDVSFLPTSPPRPVGHRSKPFGGAGPPENACALHDQRPVDSAAGSFRMH